MKASDGRVSSFNSLPKNYYFLNKNNPVSKKTILCYKPEKTGHYKRTYPKHYHTL